MTYEDAKQNISDGVKTIRKFASMGIFASLKAPLGIQLNRAAFTIYTVFFAWPAWNFRHTMVSSGWVIFGSFIFCSLLGVIFSFVRISKSRWILAVLNLLIPGAFWGSMCLMGIFSKPPWWDWPSEVVFVSVVWLGIPAWLAILPSIDKKSSEFFSPSPV